MPRWGGAPDEPLISFFPAREDARPAGISTKQTLTGENKWASVNYETFRKTSIMDGRGGV